jgi:drug/metabolite transporter (DMT)-like permease
MPHLILILAVLAVSAAPLLIRLAQPAPSLVIAASRVLMAALVLGLLGWKQWVDIIKLKRRDHALMVLAGLSLAAHFGLWIRSLSLTSTSASVALVATQPVFAGLIGYLVLREGFRRQELWGVAFAGIGCLVLAGGDLGGTSSDALWGDAYAIGGAITVPIYLLVARALRARVPLFAYLSAVNAVAAMALIVAILALGMTWSEIGLAIDTEEIYAMLGLGLICSVLGHSLLNYCVRLVPVHLVSLGILAEPVLATISTWIVFHEIPSVPVGVGGAIIVLGIYLGFGWRPSAESK